MSLTDHPTAGVSQVAFVAHGKVIDAIDAASARLGVTRSHYVRARIVEYLKNEGWLPPNAPSNKHEENRKSINT